MTSLILLLSLISQSRYTSSSSVLPVFPPLLLISLLLLLHLSSSPTQSSSLYYSPPSPPSSPSFPSNPSSSHASSKSMEVGSVPTAGISKVTDVDFAYAKTLKSTIKLIGTATTNADGSLAVFVSPTMVSISCYPVYLLSFTFPSCPLPSPIIPLLPSRSPSPLLWLLPRGLAM